MNRVKRKPPMGICKLGMRDRQMVHRLLSLLSEGNGYTLGEAVLPLIFLPPFSMGLALSINCFKNTFLP